MFDRLTELVSGAWWSYLVVFAVSYLDAIIPLVPSETLVVTAGVLLVRGRHDPAARRRRCRRRLPGRQHRVSHRPPLRGRSSAASSSRRRRRSVCGGPRNSSTSGAERSSSWRASSRGRTAVTLSAGALRCVGAASRCSTRSRHRSGPPTLRCSVLRRQAVRGRAVEGLILALGIAFGVVMLVELVRWMLRRRRAAAGRKPHEPPGGRDEPVPLQHADNPVDWYPWGEEALARAREEDRPILLSIGYAACHWCHVMEHESFEDEETARLQNELFVNVKVDREERPDLDAIYMDAVVTLTGHGGWPLTAFLTPEGEPFYGGTYFPPEPRHGLPSFRQVLEGGRREAYRERRAEVRARRESSSRPSPARAPLAVERAVHRVADREAIRGLRASFDPQWGGFGHAPKFPPHSVLELLLRRGELDWSSPRSTGWPPRHVRPRRRRVPPLLGRRALARPALREDALRQRAARSRLPPRLARDRRERYREVAEETVDYMLRDLLLPEGAFASSQDADTDGVEVSPHGRTRKACPRAARAVRARPVDRSWRARSRPAQAAARDPRDASAAGLDDKAIASWNGLAPRRPRRGIPLPRDKLLQAVASAWRVPARPASEGGRSRRVTATARRRAPAISTTTRTSRTALRAARRDR